MKIKQQKQIREFLIKEFGENRGNVLYERREKKLETLIENERNKSENQMKTLFQTILPCIALYKALSDSESDAYTCTRKYLLDKVAAKSHTAMAKMEFVPGFYAIYSSLFLKIVRSSDLWESTQNRGGDYFDTLRSISVSGTQTVRKTAVRNCAVCSATLTTLHMAG